MRILLKNEKEKIRELYPEVTVMELAINYNISPNMVLRVLGKEIQELDLRYREELPVFNWGQFIHSDNWSDVLKLQKWEAEEVRDLWKYLKY